MSSSVCPLLAFLPLLLLPAALGYLLLARQVLVPPPAVQVPAQPAGSARTSVALTDAHTA